MNIILIGFCAGAFLVGYGAVIGVLVFVLLVGRSIDEQIREL